MSSTVIRYCCRSAIYCVTSLSPIAATGMPAMGTIELPSLADNSLNRFSGGCSIAPKLLVVLLNKAESADADALALAAVMFVRVTTSAAAAVTDSTAGSR